MKTYSANVQRQLQNAGFRLERGQHTVNSDKGMKTLPLHKLVCCDTNRVYMQSSYLGELLCNAAKELGM